jgi:O-antigen/teichoic acid export membrane protein
VAIAASNAPELLLGKLQSLEAAAYYSRSSGLVAMFNRLFTEAVGAVCLPWFAKQSREHGNFAEPFLRATAYVTALGWSFALFVIFLAQPLIRLLYGGQWDDAVDLARLLAVGTIFSVPAALCHTALLSCGAVNTIAKTTIYISVQAIFFVALGSSFGLLAMGLAMIASAAATSTLWLRATLAQMQLGFAELLQSVGKSAGVACLSGVGPGIACWIFGPYPVEKLLPMAFGSAGATAGFLLGIFLLDHPLIEEVKTLAEKFRGNRT